MTLRYSSRLCHPFLLLQVKGNVNHEFAIVSPDGESEVVSESIHSLSLAVTFILHFESSDFLDPSCTMSRADVELEC